MVTPWGKCDEVAKTMIPEDAALVLQARARAAGVPYSEVLRNVLLRSAFGDAMVEEWLIGQFRSTVGTGTESPAAAGGRGA